MTRMMRRGAMMFVLAVIATVTVTGAPMVNAADKKTEKADSAGDGRMKFATVDVQQLMVHSKAGKSLQQQVEAQQNALKAEIAKVEKDLSAEQKALEAERSKLSAEEFSNKRTSYQKKLLEAKNELENRKRALDESTENAVNELRKQVQKVVFDLAQEQKIDLVLTRQNVVAAAKSIDITEGAMKELDKNVSEIKFGKPATKG